MKKIILSLTGITLFFWLTKVGGISLSTQYIAYVDIEKVFNEFYKTAQLGKELEEERRAQPEELRKLKDQIAALEELISPTTAQLTELALAKKELAEFPERIKQQEEQKTKQLMAEIYGQIKNVSEEQGYTVVLDKKSAIYGTEEIDITEEVLRRLNIGQPPQKVAQPSGEETPEKELLSPTTKESTPEELVSPTTGVEPILEGTTVQRERETETEKEELLEPTTAVQPVLEESTTGEIKLPKPQ